MSWAIREFKNRVGKYELGRVLGEGSFGKVHLARDTETGEKRAIKVINKEKVANDMMAEQIKREISTMKLVKHPNVIHLFEVMASKTKIYFVLEYVTGGDLFTKIAKQGKLREEEARKYFQQLINAVDYCHSKGVCHRDLKLENLLLDEDGNLKISDFGLSALPQQRKEDGLLHTTCGTPNYVAPEVDFLVGHMGVGDYGDVVVWTKEYPQLHGILNTCLQAVSDLKIPTLLVLVNKGYDGAKADIWSCGVVLFVLMAGYLPFDEPNVMNLYKKICKADFRCPDWFSSAARRLIIRILEPNPKNRITIPHIMESSWFKKGYYPAKFMEPKSNDSSDVDLLVCSMNDYAVSDQKEDNQRPSFLNAFDIISLSEGLDLSGLFEKEQAVKKDLRFTLRCSAFESMKKMEKSAKFLGFTVKRCNYKMKLEGGSLCSKGHLAILAKVFEVSPMLSVVEIKKAGGDKFDFDRFFENYCAALKDTAWTEDDCAIDG